MASGRTDAYAAAFFAVANAEDRLGAVSDELFALARAIEGNDDLRDALGDAHLPAERRQAIVEDLLGRRSSDLALGLVSLAVAAGRGRDLPAIVDRVLDLAARQQGRQVADVRAAVDLTDDQQTRLAAALEEVTGNPVDLRVTVDPSVVGGLVVRVGDRYIDGSVRHRLAQLRESLTAAN